MRKLLIILALSTNLLMFSQTNMNVYRKGGEILQIPINTIDSINYNDIVTPSELKYLKTIGVAGTNLGEFNFYDQSWWNLSDDGTYLYVGDMGNNRVVRIKLSDFSFYDWYGKLNNVYGFYTSNSTASNSFVCSNVISKNGYLYLVCNPKDALSGVFKMTSNGVALKSINAPGGNFTTTAVDSNDNVFVYSNDIISKYSSAGILTSTFGGFGSSDGKLNNSGYLVNIVIDSNNNLYVIDGGNSRIQMFDNNGNFKLKWTVAKYKEYNYMHLFNNKLYITEGGNLVEYSLTGVKTNSWSIPRINIIPSFSFSSQGQFIVTSNNVIFEDTYNNRIVIFTFP
jgi:hypothetical protein